MLFIKSCEGCGISFETRQNKRRFCSIPCANHFNIYERTEVHRKRISEWSRKQNAGKGNGRYIHGEKHLEALWWNLVVNRDGWKCKLCGSIGNGLPKLKGRSKGDLHVHHIFSKSEFPQHRFNPKNGIVLCRSCHFINERKPNTFNLTLEDLT